MQISIDIRGFATDTIYGRFVLQTLSLLVRGDTKNTYIIYTNHAATGSIGENAQMVSTKLKKESFFGQKQFRKILGSDNSHLYFFFDEYTPLYFKKDFIVIVPSLQEIFFPTLGTVKRYFYKKYLKNSTENAQRILCFESNTQLELNEKMNIREEKIGLVSGFFSSEKPRVDTTDIKLDIKAKHNIQGNYFIYDAGNDSHHNFERVLKIFERLKSQNIDLSLIVICEDTTKDIELRKQVLNLGIEKIVFFLGSIDVTDEIYYYGQSSGAIFPGFYSSFPFHFWKAILYETPIVASDLKSTREIMQDEIYYFNSRSTSESLEGIKKLLARKNKTTSYKKLHERLNPQNTVSQIKKCISSWESRTGK